MIPPRGRHGWRSKRKAKAGTAAGVARAFRATEAAALSRAPVTPEELERRQAAADAASARIEAELAKGRRR
jgi:hypothetical protein